MSNVQPYWLGLLSFPYPNNCAVCNLEHSVEEDQICLMCSSDLPFTYYETDLKNSKVTEVFFGRIQIEYTYSMLLFDSGNHTQKILHKLKYDNGQDLAIYLGKMMAKKVIGKIDFATIDYLIPVALHAKKEFFRGYNQSKLIAQGFKEISKIPIEENCLKKGRHNTSQTKKNRQERIDNVSNLFYISNKERLKNKHVILIDDVLTTGATLESIASVLKSEVEQIAVSIFTLAFAK